MNGQTAASGNLNQPVAPTALPNISATSVQTLDKSWSITGLASKALNWGYNQLPSWSSNAQPVPAAPATDQPAPASSASWYDSLASGVKSLTKPVNFLGERYALPFTSTPFPADPYAQLHQMDTRIHEFEQMQMTLPVAVVPNADAVSSATPAATAPILQAAATDAEFKKLTKHLTNFGILYALHWAVGKDGDQYMETMFEMTRRSIVAPGEPAPNLKQLLFAQYNDLSLIKRIGVHIIYFICTFRGFFEKTVEAYGTRILTEMRYRFAHALQPAHADNRPELIPNLIDDGIAFLEAYKLAIQDHAQGKQLLNANGIPVPNPTLKDHKNVAIEKLYGKSLKTICKEVSLTIVDQMAPFVEYKAGATLINKWMNKAVRKFLRNNLPDWMESALQKSTDATKPHKLPFVKALMETIMYELHDLQAELQTGIAPPQNRFPGTENLPDLVEKLLIVLDYGEYPTQSHVLQKIREQNEGSRDPEMKQRIQDSLIKSLNILFHYGAKPQNTEKMFTKLLELTNIPFAAAQHVTQEEVDALNEDLLGLAGQVFQEVIQEAVEEKLRGPAAKNIHIYADDQFRIRKEGAVATLDQIQTKGAQVNQRIARLSPTELKWLLRDLEELKEMLKGYSTKEKLSKKPLDILPKADREAILRPLLPAYECVNGIMLQLLRMQQTIRSYNTESLQHSDFAKMTDLIEGLKRARQESAEALTQHFHLDKTTPNALRMESISQIEQRIGRFTEIAAGIQQLQQKMGAQLEAAEIATLQNFVAAIRETEEKYKLIIALQYLDCDTRAFLRRENRQNLIQAINNHLSKFSDADRARLKPIIDNLRPPLNTTEAAITAQLMQTLRVEMQAIQNRIIGEMNQADERMTGNLPHLEPRIVGKTTALTAQQREIARNMLTSSNLLTQQINHFNEIVNGAVREEQRHLSNKQFDAMIGTAGAAAGVAAGIYLPAWGTGLVGAGLHSLGNVVRAGRLPNGVNDLTMPGPDVIGQLGTDMAVGALRNQAITAALGPAGNAIAVAGNALAAAYDLGRTGLNALPNVNKGISKKATDRVMQIFQNAYDLVRNEFLYKAGTKIALTQVIKAYRPATTA